MSILLLKMRIDWPVRPQTIWIPLTASRNFQKWETKTENPITPFNLFSKILSIRPGKPEISSLKLSKNR